MSSLRERRLANRGALDGVSGNAGASGGAGHRSGGGDGTGGSHGGPGGASGGESPGGAWTSEHRDGAIILRLNQADRKQNVLTTAVMQELDVILDQLPRDVSGHPLRGLVIASGKEGSFVAGADIAEIDRIETNAIGRFKAADGQRILQKIAELPVPTVAAINGFCLGGGMELALACRYRVASLESRVLLGLPETRLGVLPGFGGTQRLPKLIGLRPALEMILAAKLVDTRKALKMGLVDRGVPPALVVDAALEIIANPPPPSHPRLGRVDRLLETGLLSRVLFDKALAAAEEKAQGHYPAIPAVVKLIRETFFLPVTAGGVSLEGLRMEAEAFGNLVVTDVSANLRGLYFLDEDQKKFRPVSAEPAKLSPTSSRAAVLGAGIMGGGIAWAFSSRGFPVKVKDIRDEALLGALQSAAAVYKGDVKRRKLTERAADRAFSRIAVGLGWDGFRRADIVVEAVVERLDVKKAVLAELEPYVREDAIIASNTSGLSITEMAKSLARPARFAGLHFFNPVHRMPLVEIIRGKETSDATVATLWAAAKALGKTPILVKDAPGFLVNRILIPYMLEAARLYEEGVAVPRIDRVAREFGMPMGPFELADAVGIDIGLHVAEHLERSFGARMAVPAILGRMVEQKLLGQKSGKGFYLHVKGKKGQTPKLNPIVAVKEKKGEGPHDDAIRDRLFLTMLLEAGRCLEDQIVDRWEDVEIGMIYGTGFPPFRGGLIRWGSTLGAEEVEAQSDRLAQQSGPRFAFPEVLRSLLS